LKEHLGNPFGKISKLEEAIFLGEHCYIFSDAAKISSE
jgi:hypothetical protein